MAANETKIRANKLKTQSFGKFNCSSWPPPSIIVPSVAIGALQQYKTARENGCDLDLPKTPFPCGGFDALKINSFTSSPKGWPDGQGRYWWKLVLADGSTNEEFAFEYDNVRGNPDKSDRTRYWFIIHGPNGVKMEGFSWEADRKKIVPDGSTRYWRYCPIHRMWPHHRMDGAKRPQLFGPS